MQLVLHITASRLSFPPFGFSDGMWAVSGKVQEYGELIKDKFPEYDLVVECNDGFVSMEFQSDSTTPLPPPPLFGGPVYVGFSVDIKVYPKIPPRTLSLGKRLSRWIGLGEIIFRAKDVSPRTHNSTVEYWSREEDEALAWDFWGKPNVVWGCEVSRSQYRI